MRYGSSQFNLKDIGLVLDSFIDKNSGYSNSRYYNSVEKQRTDVMRNRDLTEAE